MRNLTFCHNLLLLLWRKTCQAISVQDNKSHIDGQEVPHRRARSPTSATTRLFAAENSNEISLHSPIFAATNFYLFHKNTSPPHLTPRKARYTKGLKPVRCCPNTSLTPHWHLPDTYLKKWGHSEVFEQHLTGLKHPVHRHSTTTKWGGEVFPQNSLAKREKEP